MNIVRGALYSNTCEGLNGTGVTTDNAAIGSDNWTELVTGATGYVRYDTTQHMTETSSIIFGSDDAGDRGAVRWSNLDTALTGETAIRFYLRVASIPATGTFTFLSVQGMNSERVFSMSVTPGRRINLTDSTSSGTTFASSGTSFQTDTWYRFEITIDRAAGTVDVKVYNGHSTALITDLSLITGPSGYTPNLGTTPIDRVVFGKYGQGAVYSMWMDDIALAVGSKHPIGPSSGQPVRALTNTCNGDSGVAVTALNAETGSNNWNTVVVNGTGTVLYDTSELYTGNSSVRLGATVGADPAYMTWIFEDTERLSTRFYFMLNALPGGSPPILAFRSTNSELFRVSISSSGYILATAGVTSSSPPSENISPQQWYRCETTIDQTINRATVRIYLNNDVQPLTTVEHTNAAISTAKITKVRYGKSGTVTPITFNIDSIALLLHTTSAIGPDSSGQTGDQEPVRFSNTCDGPDAQNVTTKNAESGSNNWSRVTIPTSGYLMYDSSRAFAGQTSLRIGSPLDNQRATVEWSIAPTQAQRMSTRFYLWLDAYPSSAPPIMSIQRPDLTASRILSVNISSNGYINITDAESDFYGSTATIPLKAWYRFETTVDLVEQMFTVKAYPGNSQATVPGLTVAPTTASLGKLGCNRVVYGKYGLSHPLELWMDEIVLVMHSAEPIGPINEALVKYQFDAVYPFGTTRPSHWTVDTAESIGTTTMIQHSGTQADFDESPTGFFTIANPPSGNDELIFHLTAKNNGLTHRTSVSIPRGTTAERTYRWTLQDGDPAVITNWA